jgi:hypothetical protein
VDRSQGDPQTLSLSLSLSLSRLFAHLRALRDVDEAPHHVTALIKTPACDALRLRRLESSRFALLYRGGVVLRRRSLALGLMNAQRFQINDAR